ncbi:Ig-like domain-containing protein [Granulicella sp. L60]|uniref:beta strand repeat-containing protein n=1 Tax=Granulicella sp. L60 TaxID=1641866 RepID=UPI00131E93C2|nr:Ig-like domain-containing protein [Granulicella sp. L60]
MAIAPQGAVLVVGTTLQYTATCSYSDSTTDNCAAAGGAKWSTPTNAMTVNSSGLATWSSTYDPHNANLFPSGAQTAEGMVYVTAGGLSDHGTLLAQSEADTFYPFITPAASFYQDVQSSAQLPIDVVVGSTVTIGIGYTANNTGDGNPLQMICNWTSSNPAVATVSRYGLATAVSTGTVTITCGEAGNGKYGSTSQSGNSFTFNVVSPTPTSRTWYVRPNGGSPYVSSSQTPSGQCDGLHDADYSGTGVNQPCAVGNIRDLWADRVSPNHEQWIIGPGDTVIVRQKTGGYNIGLDQQSPAYGGSATVPVNCGNPDCYMPTIPSGTASQHTKILGGNYGSCRADTAKTQLNVSWASKNGINVRDSQFVDVACFEITDQSACAYNGNYTNACTNASNQGLNGVLQSALTASTTYTDLFIHGLSATGIFGATGAGIVGDYVHIRAVPSAGISMDDAPNGMSNISVAGGFTLNNSITEFTGCVEEYPIVHNYPYIECRDAETGGYGDGFGTASTTGSWSFDHDIWRYNFQDGLDLLHSGLQNLSITNSQSYGNDGQSYKIGSAENVIFQNNLALENCNRLGQVIGDEPASAIVPGVTLCRADGGWAVMQFSPSGTYLVQNNSLVGYGDVALGYSCEAGGDNCSGAATTLQNNLFLAYSEPNYNGGESSAIFCAVVGSNCNQNLSEFPANQGWATRSNNLYYNTRSCPNSLTSAETCNTENPLLVSQPASPITDETAMDNFNFAPSASSPLIGAGIFLQNLLSDIDSLVRPNPPSIGAIEYAAGTSTLISPQATLTATPTAATAGQSVSLSVSITSTNSVVPTGTVIFYSNGAALDSEVVDKTGTATLSTSTLATGTDKLTAAYSGDSTYAAVSSNAVSLVVSAAAPTAVNTTTLLSASPATITAGQSTTFTATVAATSGTPTGTVSFLSNGTAIGSGTITSGVATFTTSTLTQGSYTITAKYAGTTSFNTSTSTSVTETVNAAAPTAVSTTTALSAAPTTITAGESTTFTATVTAKSGSPTGTVSFMNNGTAIGSGTIKSGIATLTTSSLTQGTYTITAKYAGTTTFNTSTSTSVTETVNTPAPTAVSTTTALTAAPTTITAGQSTTFTATVTAKSGSPTGTVSFTNNGTAIGSGTIKSGIATLTTSTLTQGTYTITAKYAGTTSFNTSTSTAVTETVNAPAPTAVITTTALSASPTTITAGESTTFTATVTAKSGSPTGTVSFTNNGTAIGSGTIKSGVATLTTSTLTQGTYTITAKYAGTTTFSTSTSTSVKETVNAPAPTAVSTTTALSQSLTTVTAGDPVALTASVKASSGTATGTVTFLSNGTSIGTGTLKNGIANLITSSLTQGTWQLTAQFTGNTSFKTSTSTAVTETVKAPTPTAVSTTTALSASPATITAGESTTFTATVTAKSGSPTGTVSFMNNGTAIGTGTIKSGVATLTTSSLTQGTYTITAKYAGTTSFNTSTSTAVTETVNAPAPTAVSTTTMLSQSLTTVTAGSPVTFTASVRAASGTATGTVTFLSNGTSIGTATLKNGIANLTTSSLPQGTWQLTAQFTGNTSFNASTSTAITETINAPVVTSVNTTTALAASPTTITTGQSVTFTATVKPSSGTATGTVTFMSNGAAIGTVALNSNVATLTTSSLPQGSYQITAQYAGNSSFTASASPAVTETVSALPPGVTTTALQLPASSVPQGQPVTFTATVTASSGKPSGTVSFMNGTTLLGSAPLNSAGVATYTTSSLAPGTYLLTAQYAGTSAFDPSISSVNSWTVPVSGITVTSSSPTLTLLGGSKSSSAVTLTLTPMGGYSGTLQMACTNPPTGTTCTFQPQTVTVDSTSGPVSVSMTVQNTLTTVTASADKQQPTAPARSLVLSASIFWIPGVLAAAIAGRKRKLLSRTAGSLFLLLLLGGAFGVLTGCGANSTFQTLSTKTLNVTVTGTGNVTQSISLNVISQ